jgi:hypothetical protein
MKPEQLRAWAVALGSMLAILAASGGQVLTVLGGIPALLRAYASVLPGGAWAWLLAVMVSGGLHLWVRTWSGKSLTMELATILCGAAVCIALAFDQPPPRQILAGLVGLFAGLVGLFVSKAIYGQRFRRAERRAAEDAP